ncbi:hypothetical protein C8R44DRAFT_981379 [Mycena epipterygia]|nr:hypothetical protein C8R44DRAFT_981379 [Mycena epipterygia]
MATINLNIVTVAEDQRLRRSLFLAGLVVLCYDHLLTLRLEVAHIWTPSFKRSSARFLLFRYIVLLSSLVMIPYFLGDLSRTSCAKLSVAESYLLSIQEFFICCTLALRVCAMYGFNRQVFVLLAVAALTCLALGAWSIVPVGPEITIVTDFPGCHTATSKPQAIRESLGYALPWEGMLIYDILLLGLTLRRAYTEHRTGGLASGLLLTIMVRDGALYFAMIGSANIANIVMEYSGDILTADSLAWFASAISATMLSRLMLNLHDAAHRNSTDATQATDHECGPIQFRPPGRQPETVGIFTFVDGDESRS